MIDQYIHIFLIIFVCLAMRMYLVLEYVFLLHTTVTVQFLYFTAVKVIVI